MTDLKSNMPWKEPNCGGISVRGKHIIHRDEASGIWVCHCKDKFKSTNFALNFVFYREFSNAKMHLPQAGVLKTGMYFGIL